MSPQGDPHLDFLITAFETRERLNAYLAAMRHVIARHDMLRTAILWEGLPEPVQVVWRQAPLLVTEVALDPAGGDVQAQLRARYNSRQSRIDLTSAPMMQVYIAHDPANHRWLMLELSHHLMMDNTGESLINAELEAHLLGDEASLPPTLPYRNIIAQTHLGVSAQQHEAKNSKLLHDVDAPTAPFGLV